MCDFCNDFGRWRKYFLDEEQRAYDRGWKDGWEAGRRADCTQREEEWAELYVKNPWWIDKLQRPSYTAQPTSKSARPMCTAAVGLNDETCDSTR